jgi:hypothetical protein
MVPCIASSPICVLLNNRAVRLFDKERYHLVVFAEWRCWRRLNLILWLWIFSRELIINSLQQDEMVNLVFCMFTFSWVAMFFFCKICRPPIHDPALFSICPGLASVSCLIAPSSISLYRLPPPFQLIIDPRSLTCVQFLLDFLIDVGWRLGKMPSYFAIHFVCYRCTSIPLLVTSPAFLKVIFLFNHFFHIFCPCRVVVVADSLLMNKSSVICVHRFLLCQVF